MMNRVSKAEIFYLIDREIERSQYGLHRLIHLLMDDGSTRLVTDYDAREEYLSTEEIKSRMEFLEDVVFPEERIGGEKHLIFFGDGLLEAEAHPEFLTAAAQASAGGVFDAVYHLAVHRKWKSLCGIISEAEERSLLGERPWLTKYQRSRRRDGDEKLHGLEEEGPHGAVKSSGGISFEKPTLGVPGRGEAPGARRAKRNGDQVRADTGEKVAAAGEQGELTATTEQPAPVGPVSGSDAISIFQALADEYGLEMEFVVWITERNGLTPEQAACEHDYSGYADDGNYYDHSGRCRYCWTEESRTFESEETALLWEGWVAAREERSGGGE